MIGARGGIKVGIRGGIAVGAGADELAPVTHTLLSIAVAPVGVTIYDNEKRQFVATGYYSDGLEEDVSASAVWASTVSADATVDAVGLASGVSTGATHITATIGAISGSTLLMVSAVPAEAVNTWTQASLATPPTGGSFGGACFDIARDQIVYFVGGTNQTWVLDASRVRDPLAAWVLKAPATTPGARFGCALTWDAVNNVAVLAGGTPNSDAYTWNGTNWTAVDDPIVSVYGTACFDPVLGVIRLWNGGDAVAYDTYQDRASDGTWSLIDTQLVRPPVGQQKAMWHDGTFTWLLGGTGSNPSHLWALDASDPLTGWADQSPVNDLPHAGAGMTAVYSAGGGYALVTLKYASTFETWKFDNAGLGWTQLNPITSPSARVGQSVAYDPNRVRFILCGGDAGSQQTWFTE
jgi:hypothetical protein